MKLLVQHLIRNRLREEVLSRVRDHSDSYNKTHYIKFVFMYLWKKMYNVEKQYTKNTMVLLVWRKQPEKSVELCVSDVSNKNFKGNNYYVVKSSAPRVPALHEFLPFFFFLAVERSLKTLAYLKGRINRETRGGWINYSFKLRKNIFNNVRVDRANKN